MQYSSNDFSFYYEIIHVLFSVIFDKACMAMLFPKVFENVFLVSGCSGNIKCYNINRNNRPRKCSVKKSLPENFRKFHEKTPAMASFSVKLPSSN